MTDLESVFRTRRTVMQPYAAELPYMTGTQTRRYLNTHHVPTNGKPLFAGAVQVKKRYVRPHLMPVWAPPDLLESVSPDLMARMQGTSCFHAKHAHPALMEQRSALTRPSFERHRTKGYV